jgi:hypothetical protein
MSYVIYNLKTTKLYRSPSGGVGCYKEHYATEAAAKAAMTRASRPWRARKTGFNAAEWAITELRHFQKNIEKKEMVRNLMSGEMVEQSVNTPRCCDPSSELYWSM